MRNAGFPESTIDTKESVGTDNWNLRDMVAECDVKAELYREEGTEKNRLQTSPDPQERKRWVNEYSLFRNFIHDYEDYIEDMQCEAAHLSQYD